jgi:ABC-2 type transport system permease protein
MKGATHLKYEVHRTLRNPRALASTLALPLVLFYAIASSNRHAHTDGISFPLYFMTGMAAYGALFAVFAPGGHIAIDRARGWNRQLRSTPLRARTYLMSKVVAAYLGAVLSLLLLFLAGVSLGVQLIAAQWLEMTGLLLVGVVPFVAMGIVLGHVVTPDALMPAVGGAVVFFALFGGAYGDFFSGGALLTLVKLLPSFWLVQAGKAALVAGRWPLEGWAVVAGWTVILVPLAALAYRRDTARA